MFVIIFNDHIAQDRIKSNLIFQQDWYKEFNSFWFRVSLIYCCYKNGEINSCSTTAN